MTAAGREEERLALLFGERDHTFVRFGRGKQFRSRKERDKWTEQELGQVWAQLEEKTLQLQELKRFVGTVWAGLAEAQATAGQCRAGEVLPVLHEDLKCALLPSADAAFAL